MKVFHFVLTFLIGGGPAILACVLADSRLLHYEGEELTTWPMCTWHVPAAGRRSHPQGISGLQKGPYPFPNKGPSQTCRRFLVTPSLTSSPSVQNVDVACPGQRFSGSHTSTCLPDQETNFRSTWGHVRRHHFESPSLRDMT